MSETIFALATPYGRGGIAVVRVSGPQATDSLLALSGAKLPQPRLAVLRTLTDNVSRETIDRPLVLYFAGLQSYTGEDTVEYHLHGGTAVVQSLLTALGRFEGHRLALPGEFTRRAFENNKMDLTAAEAVADLIDAETELQKQQALSQMDGALANLYDEWTHKLKNVLAYIEAGIDFSDEELPDDLWDNIAPALGGLQDAIAEHLADSRRGESLRNGVRVALVGAPNVGKSSLLNHLAAREVAIVSPMAGTTRDVIEVRLDLGGYPVILADTAGLRPDRLGKEGHDIIESEGIKRALAQAQAADIKLLLFDASLMDEPDNVHTKALLDPRSIVVLNKADQCDPEHLVALRNSFAAQMVDGDEATIYAVSALTGAGIDGFLKGLVARVRDMLGHAVQPPPTRLRHKEELEKARAALIRANAGVTEALSGSASFTIELLAEDVRLAIRHLGHITGRVDVEDLLDVIFRDFCIGK